MFLAFSASDGPRYSLICGTITLISTSIFTRTSPLCLCVSFSVSYQYTLLGFRDHHNPMWPYLYFYLIFALTLFQKKGHILGFWVSMNVGRTIVHPLELIFPESFQQGDGVQKESREVKDGIDRVLQNSVRSSNFILNIKQIL